MSDSIEVVEGNAFAGRDEMIDEPMGGVELSVVMPCLNEAETVGTCVEKALSFFMLHRVRGEVVVADNGSTDGSQALAAAAGARVIRVQQRGYGSALMGGIVAARGDYVIMGDADDSYDMTGLAPFLERLRHGADLVMGNRFRGGISRGAMPALHQFLGNPGLSFVGRLFFGSGVGDFNCGLRGFRRDSVLRLDLQATGMEFAIEVVVKATLARQRIDEVPTTLSPDGRSRPPHLRTWRDGWRTLRFLLQFSPRWLFFYPGLAMLGVGLIVGAAIIPGPLALGGIKLDVDTLVAASALMTIGVQAVLFAIFASVYAANEGFLPRDAAIKRLLRTWTLERGLVLGGLLALAGIAGAVASLVMWWGVSFGRLPYESALRLVLPSATALVVSCQIVFGTFFLSILGIRRSQRPLRDDSDAASHRQAAQEQQSIAGLAPPAARHLAVSSKVGRLVTVRGQAEQIGACAGGMTDDLGGIQSALHRVTFMKNDQIGISDSRDFLRGYTWVTVLAAGLAARLRGANALKASEPSVTSRNSVAAQSGCGPPRRLTNSPATVCDGPLKHSHRY